MSTIIPARIDASADVKRLLSLRYLTGVEREFLERINPGQLSLMEDRQLREIEGTHRFELIDAERRTA